jgi:uncharacterized RDD family membrane protein YckC
LITRCIAFLIDIVVMVLACMFATYLIQWTAAFFQLDRLAIGQKMTNWGSRAVVILITVLYLPLSWTLTGQSVGKALLGLRIVRNDPRRPTLVKLSLMRSMVRASGYWLSLLPLGLGLLMAVFDEQHRTLHDRLAGTRVVYQPIKRHR